MEIMMTKLPVEIRQKIFSFLPFKDQVKYRLVCRLWRDLITTSPWFKSRNCLNLDSFNLSEYEALLTEFNDFDMKFFGLKIGEISSMRRQCNPVLPVFLSQVCESVTYLDISSSFLQNPLIITNLSSFKVLHHLKIGNVLDFLRVAYKPCPDNESLKMLVNKLVKNHKPGSITVASAREFLEKEKLEEFEEKALLMRYKNIVLEAIANHIDEINNADVLRLEYAIYLIVRGIIDRKWPRIGVGYVYGPLITEGCCNTSVRVLSMQGADHYQVDVEKLFHLLPNVKELHIVHISTTDRVNEGVFTFAESHPEKIVELPVGVEFYAEVKEFNLPNLKHLAFVRNENGIELTDEEISGFIEKFPRLRSISLDTTKLPTKYFEYFTDLTLIIPEVADGMQLHSLKSFTNLKYLNVTNKISQAFCFLGHEPFTLSSMEKLKYTNESRALQCTQCFNNLLQAFPNLNHLSYKTNQNTSWSNPQNNHVDSIFMFQPNLVELALNGPYERFAFRFMSDWPTMKYLKNLETNATIIGQKEQWIEFGRKLKQLKRLKIYYHNCPRLEKILLKNVPTLRKFDYPKDGSNAVGANYTR